MRELTELVLRYKEIQEDVNELCKSFDGMLCNFMSIERIHVLPRFFFKHIHSFSVRERWTENYHAGDRYELYALVEGIEIYTLVPELPEGCEL